MEHNQNTSIEPINTSSSKFGVEYENNFIVLQDAKHVIGVDPKDGRNLIIENVETQKADKFESIEYFVCMITTLVYDEDTGSLYTADTNGNLLQYKIDTATKTCRRVKEYDTKVRGSIFSSHRFLHFVFFGDILSNIRVLDLSTGDFLPGRLETSIGSIYSIQVCVKSHDEIYLAVFGSGSYYSKDYTDLFDVSGLLLKSPVVLRKYLSEYLFDENDTILEQRSTIKSQEEKIQRILQERDSYKVKYNKMLSKYNDLREKNDQLQNKNKKKLKKLPEAYETQRTQLHSKHHQNNKIISSKAKKSLIGKRSFDEVNSLVIIKDTEEDIVQEKKHVSKKSQNMTFDQDAERREDKREIERLRVILNPADKTKLQIEPIVQQK